MFPGMDRAAFLARAETLARSTGSALIPVSTEKAEYANFKDNTFILPKSITMTLGPAQVFGSSSR